MAEGPVDGGNVPDERHRDREAALGGADAVEKTTRGGAGHGATWAIIGFLAVAAVLVYLLGYGR